MLLPILINIKRVLIFGPAAVFILASLMLVDGAQRAANARALLGGVQIGSDVSVALNGHAGPVSSVAFAPNGRALATATENGTVLLWDVQRSTQVRTLTGLTGIIWSRCVQPAGKHPRGRGQKWGRPLVGPENPQDTWERLEGPCRLRVQRCVQSRRTSPRCGQCERDGSPVGHTEATPGSGRSTLTRAPSPASHSVLAAYLPPPT